MSQSIRLEGQVPPCQRTSHSDRYLCSKDYGEASKDMIIRQIEGVPIPFASPRLLWRMKVKTHRAKDEADLVFLREYFRARGEEPPEG